jgi:hypothetical protein
MKEALHYARWLEWGVWISVVVLVGSFIAYITGILPAHVPLDQLPQFWNLPAAAYREKTATPAGWGWLGLVYHGDMLGLLGIAILSSCSLLPLARLMVWYVQRRDWVYAGITWAIGLVLVLAASGALANPH